MLVETALITPPVGLNLFVVQSLRKTGSMQDVIIGTLPFVLALFVMSACWPPFAGPGAVAALGIRQLSPPPPNPQTQGSPT